MQKIDEFDCVVAVCYNGLAYVVDLPEDKRELLDGACCDDNPFENIPKKKGIYMCKVEVWHNPGYFEGYRAPGEDWWEFRIVKAETTLDGILDGRTWDEVPEV